MGLTLVLFTARAESQETKHSAAAADGDRTHGVQLRGKIFLDYDNDGILDLLVTGDPADQKSRGIAPGDFESGGRADVLLVDEAQHGHRNLGDGTFKDLTRDPLIESIRIDVAKVEINGEMIRVEGGKVEISGQSQVRIEGGRVEINGQSIRADGVKKMEIIRRTKQSR
jgi:hypothetical protein